MDSKPVQDSKTMGFNVLVVVIAIAGAFGFATFEPSQEVVEFASIIAVAVTGVVNLYLRLKTTLPLHWPQGKG